MRTRLTARALCQAPVCGVKYPWIRTLFHVLKVLYEMPIPYPTSFGDGTSATIDATTEKNVLE